MILIYIIYELNNNFENKHDPVVKPIELYFYPTTNIHGVIFLLIELSNEKKKCHSFEHDMFTEKKIQIYQHEQHAIFSILPYSMFETLNVFFYSKLIMPRL